MKNRKVSPSDGMEKCFIILIIIIIMEPQKFKAGSNLEHHLIATPSFNRKVI